MNKLINSLFLASFAIIAFSCGKDYDSSPTEDKSLIRNPLQGDFKAQINGEPFVADIKSFFDESIEGIRLLNISATQFSPNKNPLKQKSISFTITNYEGKKTYFPENYLIGEYIDQDSVETKIYTSSNINDTLSYVNIIQDDDKYKGTFHLMVIRTDQDDANLKDTIQISQGEFDIPK